MSTPPPPGPFPPEQPSGGPAPFVPPAPAGEQPVHSPFGSQAPTPRPFSQMPSQGPYQQAPQPFPTAYPQPGYGAAPTPKSTNGFAVTSLVLGIIGIPFFCLYAIPSILAVIFGAVSLGQFKNQPAAYSGRGMAVAGLVCGLVGIALLVLLIAAGRSWGTIN